MFNKILFLVGLAVTQVNCFAQGCSDAGFCTMGAMKPDQPYSRKVQLKLRTMEVSFYRGTTTLTPVVYVATADFNFSLNQKKYRSTESAVPICEWPIGQYGPIGDISLCFTRNIFSSDKFDMSFSLGAKIPTNNSDFSKDGNALPMYYQTSLGTYDAIAGISVINKKWLFATGIQVPLNQNKNQFDWNRWNDQDEIDYIKEYANATNLKRGIDVMLRVERNFRMSRLNFSLGLLPIYRITANEITKNNGERTSKDAEGNVASGLALSAIGTVGYNFNTKSGIRFLIGHKIQQRSFNPDGLTRVLVNSITYIYRF